MGNLWVIERREQGDFAVKGIGRFDLLLSTQAAQIDLFNGYLAFPVQYIERAVHRAKAACSQNRTQAIAPQEQGLGLRRAFLWATFLYLPAGEAASVCELVGRAADRTEPGCAAHECLASSAFLVILLLCPIGTRAGSATLLLITSTTEYNT